VGTTIHYTVKKWGDEKWWDKSANEVNKKYAKVVKEEAEPVRKTKFLKGSADIGFPGYGFTKTYGIEPYHHAVKEMLNESKQHGFVLDVDDEKER